MKPAILLRRRLDGTTACYKRCDMRLSLGEGGEGTHDFIDDTFVGVEVECETRVTVWFGDVRGVLVWLWDDD